MAKEKKKWEFNYNENLPVSDSEFKEIIWKSVDAFPEIEARNKTIHKQIIEAIKQKPGYKYSKQGQFATREDLLELMPHLDEQTITSALIDLDLKMIDSIGTLHFPSHYFKEKKPSKKKVK
jgi:hypothetical protein